jgi:hypothetical protein
MIRRNQLIAALLATAFAGVGTSAMACGTCGGAGYGYRGFGGYRTFASTWNPAPVGEYLTTRTFIRQRPLCATRVVRVISRPAPVAELVTTRRVIVQRRLAPVAEFIPRQTCYTTTRLAPVGERIITRRAVIADSGYYGRGYYGGDSFGRVVTAPFRAVTWPFRRAFTRSSPEIVGERILVTRVATYPAKRTHISKRHHTKAHKTSMHHGKRQAKYSKRLAPVGERVVNMKCTIQ